MSYSNQSTNSPLTVLVDGTYHQQYGRNPKFVQKYGSPSNRPRQNLRGPSPSFEDSRRKGICHRCKQKWHAGHRYKPGAVRDYVRDRLKIGSSAVHIVSDLVLGLEGEARDPAQEEVASNNQHDQEGDEKLCCGESQEELSLFDELTGNTEAQHTSFVEASDKELFTNHHSVTFTGDEDAALHSPSLNF